MNRGEGRRPRKIGGCVWGKGRKKVQKREEGKKGRSRSGKECIKNGKEKKRSGEGGRKYRWGNGF